MAYIVELAESVKERLKNLTAHERVKIFDSIGNNLFMNR